MGIASISQYFVFALTGIVVYGLYVVGSNIIKKRRIVRAIDRFPANPRHWLWGHLHEIPKNSEGILKYFESLVEKYPRACGFFIGGFLRTSLIVQHPDTVKEIMLMSEPKPQNFGMYKYCRPWLGLSLPFIEGARWARDRKLLNPAFHYSVLKQYTKISNKATDILIDKLSSYADSGESVEVHKELNLLTMDVILRCTFSYESHVQTDKTMQPFYHAFSELVRLWFARCLRPWLYFDFVYYLTEDGKQFKKLTKYLHRIFDKIIKDKREILKNPDYKPPYQDMSEILMLARDEDGNGMTDIEIRDEVNTFIFAGSDTVAVTLAWTLASLADNPEFQKKCQKEIDDVFEGRENENEVKWEDLQKLNYLTMCLKETLRLHTTVPIMERQITNSLDIDGVVLPAGTIVTILIHNLHRNPTIWKEPTKYIPQRFENMDNIDRFAFIPFSTGPRICIGQNLAMDEMKITLCKILRRFNLNLDKDKKIEKEFAIVLRVKDGIYLKISKR